MAILPKKLGNMATNAANMAPCYSSDKVNGNLYDNFVNSILSNMFNDDNTE